jgi:hypothetical protein
MKTKNDHELSAEQKEFVKKLVRDPVLFANHILGVTLWEREAEILRSIQHRRRTAIKACHGVGKTFTLAVAALWWLARYLEGIALTTSATQRQVKTQVWFEIHRAAERAKVPYPKLKTTELKFRDDNNFAIGFSTNQAENFQGYHGKNVLIISTSRLLISIVKKRARQRGIGRRHAGCSPGRDWWQFPPDERRCQVSAPIFRSSSAR